MSQYPIDKLITDFDETISERDTISTLVHTAADSHAHIKRGVSRSLAGDGAMVFDAVSSSM